MKKEYSFKNAKHVKRVVAVNPSPWTAKKGDYSNERYLVDAHGVSFARLFSYSADALDGKAPNIDALVKRILDAVNKGK
jgi:hypothetical protein